MPKLEMSHNSRLVLYSVLKKVWQTFRNRDDYKKKYVLLTEDYEKAKEPVILTLADLKPLFFKNATYSEIQEHIRKVPLDAEFRTYYDLFGKKRNYLMLTKIALFTEIQFDDEKKEITFNPAKHILNYIEALKSFARIDISEMKYLNSNYAIRAYEYICQNNYCNKNNNKLVDDEVRKIRIEDFKRYFEIPESYSISDIDRRVLKPIKKLINKYTKYNLIEIKKFKLNPNNKCKVTHYRIDVEYKEEYIQELKEKEKNKKLLPAEKDIFNYDDTFKMMKEQAREEIREDYEE